MKVVVFGATGGTGLLVVRDALRRGHEVTVLGGPAGSLGDASAGVRVVTGDSRDAGAVSDAVDGQEAVIVTLADMSTDEERGAAAKVTQDAIRSMRRYGVRRLVVLSASAAAPGSEAQRPGFFARLRDPLAKKDVVADLRRLEVSVRQSTLDWTLVRATRLTDGPARSTCRSGPGYTLQGGGPIARADVAAFLLDELERVVNVQHAVAIAS